MQVELHCSHCSCLFLAPENADYSELTFADEPWYALGDGNTFEDSIHGAISDGVSCPACGEPIAVSEEQLGKLAMEILAAF
jgi:hypothetical protein